MDQVDRDDVEVLFLSAVDEIADIRRAWDELETAVGSLRGRKFYGIFDPVSHEYRACVQAEDLALAFSRWTIPGGRYVREKLVGEPPAVYERIGPTVDEVTKQVDIDESRPVIEFYRRHDEIHILVPVR